MVTRALHWRWMAVAVLALQSVPASAALFGDDEARKAILELRQRFDNQRQATDAALTRSAEENAQLRRSLLELQAQIDGLKGELATLRGQNEQLARELSEVQRRQRDVAQGVDERLRRFEPIKVSIDGREFMVDPAEKREFDAAMEVFKTGNFMAAQSSLLGFARRYPSSGYRHSVLFWLGNAQYGTREYSDAINNFRMVISEAPDHPRAPEAMLAIANCQVELKDLRAARKTLEDLVKAHPQTEAGQTARERLSRMR